MQTEILASATSDKMLSQQEDRQADLFLRDFITKSHQKAHILF